MHAFDPHAEAGATKAIVVILNIKQSMIVMVQQHMYSLYANVLAHIVK